MKLLILVFLTEDSKIKNKVHNSACDAKMHFITAELLMVPSACKRDRKNMKNKHFLLNQTDVVMECGLCLL